MYENRRVGFLFALPFVLGVLGFKLFPFVMSFALSFSQFEVFRPPQFVGLDNYAQLAQDPSFHSAMGATLWFVALAVPLRVGFALLVAHVLNYKLRGIGFFRAAFYLPSILGGSIAVAVLWRFIFARNGLVNQVLAAIGLEPVMWLADEQHAMWTIVLLFTWQFGSSMVIFLAALQNVPTSLYEAAELDGASKWQQFWRITVPLITPVIFFNLIMQLVHGFQEFNGPYMVTEGGPLQSTYLLSLYIYEESFRYFNLGYGAAMSWVMFAVVGAFSAISFWSSRYWVFYAGEKERAK
ncbi:carbohydrate ABC transporter permease [Aquabacterium sp. OR-4]|uniref:carbohydrate ABC transporter permease n=1 Tax=Aquabacterium sp. OR-4 TaxID=2978127 RepID=UPI0028C97416|nr:sugar ABC transporter permease [Aquabacterium sp. OR-4]MDT7837091.1 sugar ABC transporter permease [Aquabacterium sp. OR-4]